MPEHGPPRLPAGYRSRAASMADSEAIHGLVTDCERDLLGHAEVDVDDVTSVFARAGLDPARDTLVVFDPGGTLVARAWVHRRSEVDVHPGHRGRGLGAALLDWVESRAREAGTARVVQSVPDGDRAAVALVRARGYAPLATNWLLAIGMPTEPVVPEPAEGITVRAFRRGDGPAVHRLMEDAFDEWQERRRSYAEWATLTVERGTFAPAMSPLAFHGTDLVGAVLSLDDPAIDDGYVERVAVRRDHRNRGIARLLLRHAFRACYRRGRRSCTLWTHSRTGALSLYERVGMSVRRSSTVHALALPPG